MLHEFACHPPADSGLIFSVPVVSLVSLQGPAPRFTFPPGCYPLACFSLGRCCAIGCLCFNFVSLFWPAELHWLLAFHFWLGGGPFVSLLSQAEHHWLTLFHLFHFWGRQCAIGWGVSLFHASQFLLSSHLEFPLHCTAAEEKCCLLTNFYKINQGVWIHNIYILYVLRLR